MNVLAHNLLAMNSNRQLGLVTQAKAKSTEKLSSGYQINRAADDAAGLAISEKMRRQIRGLTQASANAQDGISMVQVADGALNEMHDIMQRMNELAVKASNDTNNVADRGYINEEIKQLRQEITRISTDTSFNEINLFNWPPAVKMEGDYSHADMDEMIAGTPFTNGKVMDFSDMSPRDVQDLAGRAFNVHCSMGCPQIFHFEFNEGKGDSAKLVTGSNSSRPDLIVDVDISGLTTGKEVAQKIYDLAQTQSGAIPDKSPVVGGATVDAYIGHVNGMSIDDGKLTFFSTTNNANGFIEASDLDSGSKNFDLQVGSEAGQFLSFSLFTINANTLGVNKVDVSTKDGAQQAIDAIKKGINKLSSYRSYYGAVQNRLEHTIKNLDNVVENTTAAESLIRDTDMAKEMVQFSNQNILEQAGVSMLTQANQQPQSVLSLLQM